MSAAAMSALMTMPDDADAPLRTQQAEARRLARVAGAVLVFGLAPIAGWMAFAPLSSAVVAQAFVKVDLDRRPVQHAEGGTVREVLVRDGQQVKLGEPLLGARRRVGWTPT
jgi:multidrug efflux pump subunit AcrA (membrane-fusion protein)